jgi:molybdopterin/thiamine biosynthesis adenylyltransferase
MTAFDYDLAFSRNHGITTQEEQQKLKNATVAIAGMGGVGGDYLITLLRTGIGHFKIADFDTFELANFNRQYGATVSTIGRSKIEVMTELALDINPEASIKTYNGVNEETIDDFLVGVDVFIDAIEFFEIKAHRLVTNACMKKGIIAIFGVPLGFGTSVLVYKPEGMSFDDYFDVDYDAPLAQQALKMALGIAPAAFHINYIKPGAFKFGNRQAPSMASGCKLTTGFVITQVILALLHPDELKPLPHYINYDARLGRLKKGHAWMGNRNPMRKLKYFIASKKFSV